MSLYSVSIPFKILFFSLVSSRILSIDKWWKVHIFHWKNLKYAFEVIGSITDERLEFEWCFEKVRDWIIKAFN